MAMPASFSGRTMLAIVALLQISLLVAGCTSSTDSNQTAENLAASLDSAAIAQYADDIAGLIEKNGGASTPGSSGFDAAADYIATKLRSAGLAVDDKPFTASTDSANSVSLTVNGSDIPAYPMPFSKSSGQQGVTGRLVMLDSAGCDNDDYRTAGVRNAIVVVNRGGCSFHQKQSYAGRAEAAAMIIVSDGDLPTDWTMTPDPPAVLPMVAISREDGSRLRGMGEDANAVVVLDNVIRQLDSRNVVARTGPDSTEGVLIVGTSLGIGPQPNPAGAIYAAAALIDLATKFAKTKPSKPVVFGFWADSATDTTGSRHFITSIAIDARKESAYLAMTIADTRGTGITVYDAPAQGEKLTGAQSVSTTLTDYLKANDVSYRSAPADESPNAAGFPSTGIPVTGIALTSAAATDSRTPLLLTPAKASAYAAARWAN
ncbi:PA domain-containing protein [Nocardia sp. NPDC056000]|uniref:PA domain-containing protein n=1 Tax=Nocardia sp. NPDC056000 TaxID=3345674 RepID=UPI0035DEEF58